MFQGFDMYIYYITQQRSSQGRQVALEGAHTNQGVSLEKLLRSFVGMNYTKCVCNMVNTRARQWEGFVLVFTSRVSALETGFVRG